MGRPRSKLTEKQETYVNERMLGKSKRQSALAAGFSSSQQVDKSETVRCEIAEARKQISNLTTLKRLDVIEGIMESIAIGRMMSDAAAVRQGWVEIGKIIGAYAPEVKQINLTINQERLLSKFQTMTIEDLLAVAEGRVIDGEATTVQ